MKDPSIPTRSPTVQNTKIRQNTKIIHSDQSLTPNPKDKA